MHLQDSVPIPPFMPDEVTLEDWLSRPTNGVVQALAQVPGDFLILGIGGKMGPSLARMIRRASAAAQTSRRIIGVARFSQPALEAALQAHDIETLRCDLLEDSAIERLPEVPNLVFMTGMKFGGSGQAARMWAMNTLVPARLAERFPASRWLVFSTGNVYPFTKPARGGPVESDPLEPVGEYGMSCLGRERTYEYASLTRGTPVSVIRLNYACDLRYGVLVDLAQQIWQRQPVDLRMGYFNTIWQGDANALSLQAMARADSPPFVINVTGLETLSVREVAQTLGRIMGKPVSFTGQESETALLSNAHQAAALLGQPAIQTDLLIQWVAHWIMQNQPTLGKPTHFQVRTGQF